MLAFDVAALLLAIGIGALVVTSAVTGLSMPTRRRARRPKRGRRDATTVWYPVSGSRRREPPIPATYRRCVVTGPPATLPPVDTRRPALPADDPVGRIDARAAEQLIDHMIGTDPEEVARLMTVWIREDDRTSGPSLPRRPAAAPTSQPSPTSQTGGDPA